MTTDSAAAYELHHRALETRRAAGLRTFFPDSLDALATFGSGTQADRSAVRILAASRAARIALGTPRNVVEAAAVTEAVDRLRETMGEDFRAAWHEGEGLSLDQAVALLQRGRGTRARRRSGWESLTPTESEVLDLVAQSLSNAAIGGRLFMSRSTVKTHMAHMFDKLRVRNRTELAAAAARGPRPELQIE